MSLTFLKFAVAVQIHAVKFNMRVDIGLIHIGTYHKLVLSAGKLHSQLIANPVGFLRADLTRLEGLDNPVHDDIMLFRLAPSGNLVI